MLAVLREDDTFVLHRADVFYGYLDKPYSGEALGRDYLDLYFTTGALEEAEQRLREAGVKFIHGIKKFHWGERLFRVYDPDGHIVEIGDAGQDAR